MGEPELNRKILQALLSLQDNDDERTVLYIIVELQKITERRESGDLYPFLDLFRNWCTHTYLNRRRVAEIRDIINDINVDLEELFLGLFRNISELGYEIDEGLFRFYLLRIVSEQPLTEPCCDYSVQVDMTQKKLVRIPLDNLQRLV